MDSKIQTSVEKTTSKIDSNIDSNELSIVAINSDLETQPDIQVYEEDETAKKPNLSLLSVPEARTSSRAQTETSVETRIQETNIDNLSTHTIVGRPRTVPIETSDKKKKKYLNKFKSFRLKTYRLKQRVVSNKYFMLVTILVCYWFKNTIVFAIKL